MALNTPLTDAQRKLVADNMGLVGVHLRRCLGPRHTPHRDREWEDLFQEGCLGLALAAARYDASSGLPFAAFAIARIRTAVARALPRVFATLHVPESELRESVAGPKRVPLLMDPAARPAAARHDPFAEPADETIGDRIRAKYESAVHLAARDLAAQGQRDADDRTDPGAEAQSELHPMQDSLGAQTEPRPSGSGPAKRDRHWSQRPHVADVPPPGVQNSPADDDLEGAAERNAAGRTNGSVDGRTERSVKAPADRGETDVTERLVAERLLIPEESYRHALRQVARDTKTNYARVHTTERRLIERIRERLSEDVELDALRQAARRRRAGMNTLWDAEAQDSVSAALEQRIRRLFAAAPGERRMDVLERVIEMDPIAWNTMFSWLLRRLDAGQKAALLSGKCGEGGVESRKLKVERRKAKGGGDAGGGNEGSRDRGGVGSRGDSAGRSSRVRATRERCGKNLTG